MPSRCAKTCPQDPIPPSFPLEAARTHPRYRYLLEPGARCTLDAGHEGKHRAGGLTWHDPKVLFVGDRRVW